MACGGFFTGNAGDVFRFRVTQPNNAKVLTGALTEFNRATNVVSPPTVFKKAALLAGVPVQLAANCSYHFQILQSPASNTITVTVTPPAGQPTVNQCSGQFVGPWIIQA
jgi:hypothetical protein